MSSEPLACHRIESRALKVRFGFIRQNTTLTSDKDFFVGLVEDIDESVNTFILTHKYHDALGQFYVQFLRYANNDKGLGIVLTPPHVAELFADLADVNKTSVVFDNCCGTAGLLIAAMKRMLSDETLTEEAENTIKKQQLIRDSPDQTTFPGYSSRGDTAKYNPAFQGRQMRSDAA